MENRKLLLYLGVLAPIIFAGTVFYAASLHPDYSHYKNYMSELGATGMPDAYIMNLGGFYINSIMLLIFALTMPSYIDYQGALKTWAVSLFVIHAIGLNGAGIFPCDFGCSPAEPSLVQIMHSITANIGVPALSLSILLWGVIFFRLGHSKLARFSFLIFIVSMASFIMLSQTVEDRMGTGLYQRITVFSTYIWVFLTSLLLIIKGRLTCLNDSQD